MTPSPSPSASAHTPPAPPTDADWAALASQVSGTVVRPSDPAYSSATLLFNPRFDGSTPAGIVYCASVSDVQRSVAFARTHALPITARSGGHSYAGYSTGAGVVCDVTRMAAVVVQPGGSAVIGGGARLIDVFAALSRRGLALAAGSCPTVGIAGLALGGGLGVVGRKFGLTSDNVTALQIVTADGDALRCDAGTNSDLYWACRGGGGGNFGVVTSLTTRTHSVPAVTLFTLHWPWPAAMDVIAAWQQWITTIPDELWSICHVLSTTSPGSPSITVDGAYVGNQPALTPWLTRLRQSVGTPVSGLSVGTHSFLDAMLIEAGCGGGSVASCHLPQQDPHGRLQREASLAHSDIALQPWSTNAIGVIVAGVAERQANPSSTTVAGVAMEALGGAINRVASGATAFVHRGGLFSTQYNATWPTGASPSVVQSNIAGVNAIYGAMRPFASGYAYQNYIDPSLADWKHAYYGDNLQRLMAVKARYDPDGLFNFAQSIPPA